MELKEFTNLHNLTSYFVSEKVCVDYLVAARWGNSGVACTTCGAVNPYKIKVRGKDGYKCRKCKKFFNVLVGTMFENTKLPLIVWFKAIYLATAHKKGISSCQLARDLGVTQKTGWFMLSRIRSLVTEEPVMLEGEIEIDETFCGIKAHNRKQSLRQQLKRTKYNHPPKTIVFGMVQRGGKIVTHVIPIVGRETMLPLIEKHVKKGSTIYTDQFQTYKGLKYMGYNHQSVSHDKKEFVRGSVHVNGIEGYWSILKRGILGIYHFTSKQHLFRYCNEFSFRYNSRKISDAERFGVAIKQMENTRLAYHTLIGKPPIKRA